MEDVALDVEKMEGVSMKEQIWEYVVSLYKDIPLGVYVGLAAVLCVGGVLMMVKYGGRQGVRMAAGLLLVEYVFVLYSSTVLFRATSVQFSGYDLHPFWSYRAIRNGENQLLVENIMNAVVFVPVGVLLGFMVNGSRFMVRHGWLIALIVGIGISVSIEAMQFFLKRGFSEVDDVMHNTAGCLIGYMLVVIIKQIWLLQKRYWMS